jgi:hypothetical protein
MYDYGGRSFQYSRIRFGLPNTRGHVVIALEAVTPNSSPRK